MIKKIFLFGTFLLITGCTQKTVYKQVKGDAPNLYPSLDSYNAPYFDKAAELRKVDNVASQVFGKLSQKIKNENSFNQDYIMQKIYNGDIK